MQNIYDNDYNFAKPPLKPNLTVVPGDRQVTLFWDKLAENSLDAIYAQISRVIVYTAVPTLDLLIHTLLRIPMVIIRLINRLLNLT